MMKQSSISSAQKSMSSRILCCASERFFNIRNLSTFGRTELQGQSREKLQRLWCYQRRADWIRMEHFAKIHNVAALREVNDLLSNLVRTTSNFYRNSLYVDIQRHFLWNERQWSPQGAWDNIAEQRLLEFAESGHPTFCATTPLSGLVTARYSTIETIFRIIVSANQLSLYGAVASMCEEFETHQDRSGEPDVLMGQSFVLSESKASHQNLLLQRYE